MENQYGQYCLKCGETRPEKFNENQYVICASCNAEKSHETTNETTAFKTAEVKSETPATPKPKTRKKQPYKCKVCGESNPDMFYGKSRGLCKTCVSIGNAHGKRTISDVKTLRQQLELINLIQEPVNETGIQTVISFDDKPVTVTPKTKAKKPRKRRKPKITYIEAKEKVQRLGFINKGELQRWHKNAHKPDIPRDPEKTYPDEWEGQHIFYDTDPTGRMSGGSRKIYRHVLLLEHDFEMEKTFEGCRDKKPLRFDYFIKKYNLCIEFDGEQHFRPSNYSKNKEENLAKFEKTRLHDEIKNKYCKDNGINLLRIDNYEFDRGEIECTIDQVIGKIIRAGTTKGVYISELKKLEEY